MSADERKDAAQPWVARARELLDDSAAGLDGATLSRLNRARQAALSQGRRAARPWMVPTGLASACVLLLALFTWHAYLPSAPSGLQELPVAKNNNVAAADVDLVAGEDSLEFYQDLEFYAWLEAQDQDLGS